ncbi:MAG: PAS domain S-box protein, partial [Candidatus Delongbacteria bacterium]|nr:PAS domain S-box protein [Candidatus Delongbacteria bacterium]
MSGLSHIICYSVNFLLIGLLVWLLVRKKKFKNKENSMTRLIQDIGEGITIVDENENFVLANRSAERILEVKEGELIGKNLTDFLIPEEVSRFRTQTEMRSKGLTESYELNIVTARGNKKVINVTVSPNCDENGHFVSSYGIFRDVTNIKEYEKKLELKQMELERSNNDLEQFAHTVSHDLQEPLRMVSSFTDLLLKK